MRELEKYIEAWEARQGLPSAQEIDTMAFFVALPYSDLKVAVPEGSLIDRADNSLDIGRLSGIRQLGILTWVGSMPVEEQYFLESHHTRRYHTSVVSVVMDAMLKSNSASEHQLAVGAISATVHDRRSPALGDAVKTLSPKELDEEDFWDEALPEPSIQFISEHGVVHEEIDNTVHNRGVLGQALDVADRIAYVMHDTHVLVGQPRVSTILDSDKTADIYRWQMVNFLERHPDIGNIYRDVAIDWDKEQVYFTNPERLEALLDLRANLYRRVYA